MPASTRVGSNIWIAAGDGDLARVQELVEHHSVDPNAPDENTYTPMFKPKHRLTLLAYANANKELSISKNPGLWRSHAAASYGQLEVLEYLVSRGGNVNITDSDGDTPLYTVENVETAQWLVDHGAIVERRNAEGVSPAEHLAEDFPSVSTYLNSLLPSESTSPPTTTTPTSPPTTDPALTTLPTHPHPLPSQHAQNLASEALTSSLLSDAQAIMERAEREGREGDEGVDEELRAVVSRAVGRGLLRGLEMGEGMDVDEADGEGRGRGRRRGGGQGDGGERGEKRSRMDE